MTTEQPTTTDPAAILLALLNRARQHSQGTVAQGFAKVFEIDANDTPELFRRLSVSEAMAQRVLELIKNVGNDPLERAYQKNLASIVQFFAPRHLDQTWEEHKKKIFERDITALEYCSGLLAKTFQEQVIDKETLNALSQKVDDLYTEVRDSDLDQHLKRTVLNGLQAIKNAVHDYTIRGADALQEALTTALGDCVILNAVQKKKRKSKKSKKKISEGQNEQDKPKADKLDITKKLLDITISLFNVVNMASASGPSLFEKVSGLIHRLLPPPK